MSIPAGTRVDRYVVEASVGAGSMGDVLRGLDVDLNRRVAIKILSPRLRDDSGYMRRLQREAKLAAKLRHANVVAVIDQGTCQQTGEAYVAFEFIDGQNAAELLKERGRLPVVDALTICLAIADALA